MDRQPFAKKSVHFRFLDSCRGLSALIVVIAHIRTVLSKGNTGDVFFELAGAVDHALEAFFLLSSFLLTYRMISEIAKHGKFNRKFVHIIAKYFIRRFFRIYLVYFAYVSFFTMVSKLYSSDDRLRSAMMPSFANW
jgi:peptidoglycan/LPS O-acetylase OafA/YrhL